MKRLLAVLDRPVRSVFRLTASRPAMVRVNGFPTSDHRLVWADLLPHGALLARGRADLRRHHHGARSEPSPYGP
jgi:hypothetical protein